MRVSEKIVAFPADVWIMRVAVFLKEETVLIECVRTSAMLGIHEAPLKN